MAWYCAECGYEAGEDAKGRLRCSECGEEGEGLARVVEPTAGRVVLWAWRGAGRFVVRFGLGIACWAVLQAWNLGQVQTEPALVLLIAGFAGIVWAVVSGYLGVVREVRAAGAVMPRRGRGPAMAAIVLVAIAVCVAAVGVGLAALMAVGR